MARLSLSFVATSLALALLSAANPVPEYRWDLDVIPREASKLAFDEELNRIIAFDASGKHLGAVERRAVAPLTRRGGSCAALSADDAQKLPGWEKLKQQANDNWGDHKRKIVTNDDDFPTQPASICAQDAGDITIDGDSDCTSSTQTLSTGVTDTTGIATVSQTTGTSFTSSQTVTQESSISVGETFDVKVGIPEVVDVSSSTSLTATFSNSLSTTTSSTSNQQTTQTVAINIPKDSTCDITYSQTSCTTKGSGQVPFTATGWVWFEYDSKQQGHYKWALNMDDLLSDDERSSYMKFDSVVSTDTKGDYNASC
ncbi:hypothetical protein BD626DRAFT_544437 [Schizophyllum amplum]|uniref:Ubiquitin 3 binding protein But2 C-terminal domain-containing protein n=1 Tax=Schizophyllum amplum TaxID=97359 RepID=A0A550CYI4_9AGAR|nr:hypothetical protein BD626DRAFT_544437 [Auriculariopsis ampla]